MIRGGMKIAAVVICSWGSGAVGAAQLSPEGPFLELSFDQALARAAKEQRVVFIDFYTTWCGPCKLLDSTTWKDEKVLALLKQKAIPLKIDAEKEVALSKKYAVNAYPTLLLLNPDGSILDRLVGYQSPEQFIVSIEGALAGKNSLVRAQEAAVVAQKGDLKSQVEARYKLARILAEQHLDAEALKEFLWLYDDGMKNAKGYAGVRVSFLLSDLEGLGKRYPLALEALLQRRDAAKSCFLASPGDADAGGELISLNRSLKQTKASLEIFDSLPSGSPGRKTLGPGIWEELLILRRYVEAMELRPLKVFLEQFSQMKSRIDDPKSGTAFKRFYLENCAKEIEALAGAGNLQDATALIEKTLSIDTTEGTMKLVREHLLRAEHPELLK